MTRCKLQKLIQFDPAPMTSILKQSMTQQIKNPESTGSIKKLPTFKDLVKNSVWRGLTTITKNSTKSSGEKPIAQMNIGIEDLDTDLEEQERKQEFKLKDAMFLDYRKSHHIRINRARLIDWLVETCYIYKLRWQTLWTTIEIIDRVIIEKGKIKLENIHITGVTALFIASKYHQTTNKISIKVLAENICWNKFSKKQILDQEASIFGFMCVESPIRSLHFPTMVDRVKDLFPELQNKHVKDILTELLFFYQFPEEVYENYSKMTQNKLIEKVWHAIRNGERFEDCKWAETILLDQYRCHSIRDYAIMLPL